jgi:16S rRNA (guanine1207-N2)-methyltransferase
MVDPAAQPAGGQYFEAEPQAASSPRTVVVDIDGVQLSFTTDSGVFSPARLDAGTRLLLVVAPPLTAGERRVLDLGCGWGPIACVAALRSPATEVLAVDVNERALTLTAQNAAAHGATNVSVAHPDDVNPDRRYDRILCNPPIRIGKPALHDLLATWLDRLAPGGRAHLVVQRHLGSDSLARWLTDLGHRVTRLSSKAGYRLLEVQPTDGSDPQGIDLDP